MIALEDIPEGCFSELKEKFHYVDLSTYGNKITRECKSRRFEFRIVENTNDTVKVLDPLTFEPKMIENVSYVTVFIARGIFTESVFYSVRGISVKPSVQLYLVSDTGRIAVSPTELIS